ncbi:hypothetical protein EG68_03383 [Paragonimus skrjabini miyazakii]|uniref:Uncharacterized protein n=1 Tax=Paragonimus skrjabini miyazakii TaxID=59628 RepID=A0A8S9YY53_9TREM|nr:hypothetical protein EG68_03383 [Paragonimus skrjabini miyazakii]
MDDVFDQLVTDEQVELIVGSKEWLQREQTMRLSAERDGLFAAREGKLQSSFEAGVHEGFALLCRIATYRGRLTMRAQLCQTESEKFLKIVERLLKLEGEIADAFLTSAHTGTSTSLAELRLEADNLIQSAFIL